MAIKIPFHAPQKINNTQTTMMKLIYTTMLMAASLLVSGCAKEPPKCSDLGTQKVLREIITAQLGNRDGITDKELEENLQFELPRASAYDEKIKKYSCEAKLIAGRSISLPVAYSSQLDDDNKHIVSVEKIAKSDIFAVGFSVGKGIQEGRLRAQTGSTNEKTNDPTPAASESPPSAAEGTPYGDLRKVLLTTGWMPLELPNADACSDFDDRCKGRPEMESCSGGGMAYCKFAWKKNYATLKVCTTGEDALFASYCE